MVNVVNAFSSKHDCRLLVLFKVLEQNANNPFNEKMKQLFTCWCLSALSQTEVRV